METLRGRSKLTLIPVTSFLAQHPEFKNQDANHAICWKDTLEDIYLVDPNNVDEHGQCTTFYYRHTSHTSHEEHPLIGLELPLRADNITEVEPKLYKLEFS